MDTLSIDDERPDPLRVAGFVIGGRIGVDFQVSNARIKHVDNGYLTIDLANGARLTFDDFWTKGRLVFLQVSNATLELTVRGVRARGPIAPLIAKLVERGVRCVSLLEGLYLPFCATELLARRKTIQRIGFYESDDYVQTNTMYYKLPTVRSESEKAALRQRLVDNYDHEQFMQQFHFATALRNRDLDAALRLITEGGRACRFRRSFET